MPIAVKCACGKALNAPDALAGKKAKCPACGAVLSIPGTSAAPAPTKPATRPPAAAKAAPAPALAKPVSSVKPAAKPAPARPAPAKAAPKSSPSGTLKKEETEQELHAHSSCPSCGAFVSKKDALCVQCGTHLLTGKKLSTQMSSEPTGPVKPVAILCLVLNLLLPGVGTLIGKGATGSALLQLVMFLGGVAAANPWAPNLPEILDGMGGFGIAATGGGIGLWLSAAGWGLVSGLKILKNAKPG